MGFFFVFWNCQTACAIKSQSPTPLVPDAPNQKVPNSKSLATVHAPCSPAVFVVVGAITTPRIVLGCCLPLVLPTQNSPVQEYVLNHRGFLLSIPLGLSYHGVSVISHP